MDNNEEIEILLNKYADFGNYLLCNVYNGVLNNYYNRQNLMEILIKSARTILNKYLFDIQIMCDERNNYPPKVDDYTFAVFVLMYLHPSATPYTFNFHSGEQVTWKKESLL